MSAGAWSCLDFSQARCHLSLTMHPSAPGNLLVQLTVVFCSIAVAVGKWVLHRYQLFAPTLTGSGVPGRKPAELVFAPASEQQLVALLVLT